jgi:UDP-glucose 4-epimerase
MAMNDFNGVYNIAYGGRITINKLVDTIKDITGSESKVLHLAERAGDVKHSMAAVDKLNATGFKPENDFASGLAETIKFFQNK